MGVGFSCCREPMLEAELFAHLERTSDAAFAVTETGEICFLEQSWPRGSSVIERPMWSERGARSYSTVTEH